METKKQNIEASLHRLKNKYEQILKSKDVKVDELDLKSDHLKNSFKKIMEAEEILKDFKNNKNAWDYIEESLDDAYKNLTN